MKKILLISTALLLVTTSIAVAQDAASVLASAQEALGLNGATSLAITANGSIKDNGEAAGGNAPVPVVAEYHLDLDFAAPATRLRIHRTNPDGTELGYGGTELQFVSGNYVWQVFTGQSFPAGGGGPPPGGGGGGAGGPPGGGAGGPPGGGAGGPPGGAPAGPPPKPEDTFAGAAANPIVLTGALAQARQTQLALTPAGFIALASKNSATVSTEGGNQLVSFTTAAGQKAVGTIGGDGLLTEVTTTDPLTGQTLTASFGGYQKFGAVTYPSSLVQTEAGEEISNLTVTAVTAGAIPEISVPASVADFKAP